VGRGRTARLTPTGRPREGVREGPSRARLRFVAPTSPEHVAALPARCRPLVRYRPEAFGYLAAFPEGHVAMYDEAVEPLLAAGESYEECRPHLLTRMNVPTEFHFSAPLMAWIELTRKCNLRCPHCFVEGGAARSTELSTERILTVLEEWAEMGVFAVVLTGGEPTIQPDFLTIARRAYDLGFVVSIATNGVPLTDKLLDEIPSDDVIISMSLDGIHGQGRKLGLSDYEFITRRLLEVRDRGFNTSIMTTTTSQNVGDLQTIIDWAVDNDISLRSVPFVPMGRGALYRELLNTTADVELAARFWIAEEQWERVKDVTLGLCSGKIFNFLLTMVFATRRCMSGRGLCYVTSAGDVYPCSTCSGAKALCAGNLQMNSFRDIWDSEDWDIRKITWGDFSDTCRGCPINADKYFCTGRCPANSLILNGVVNGCGTTPFQLQSILRREELFRQAVQVEPRVLVGASDATGDA
jgi:radical SAM protein with 4Fe4S-binding SPASM domain